MIKHIAVFVAAVIVAAVYAFGLEFSERLLPAGVPGFVAKLEAVVGRPLTPVSVAGVARRTARRCSAGVYDC
jgi:hypothetical protein